LNVLFPDSVLNFFLSIEGGEASSASSG
jgi:hypothetical protein